MIPRIYHNLHNCKKKNCYKEIPATIVKWKMAKVHWPIKMEDAEDLQQWVNSIFQLHSKAWKETYPVVNTFISCSPTHKLHCMASHVVTMEMLVDTWLVVCKVLPDRPRPCYHHWELMILNKTHLWTKWKPEATQQRYSGVACQIIVVVCKLHTS